MTRIAALLVAATILPVFLATETTAQDKDKKKDGTNVALEGHYSCARTILGGMTDEGLASLSEDGDGYSVKWTFDSGKVISGVGVRDGDRLAVSWSTEVQEKGKKKLNLGISLFKITVADGKPVLKGHWIDQDGTGVKFKDEMDFTKARKK